MTDRLWPTGAELMTMRQISAALPVEHEGWPVEWSLDLYVPSDSSPWLLFRVRPVAPHVVGLHEVRMALWRTSGVVFLELPDGSVAEDPLTPEQVLYYATGGTYLGASVIYGRLWVR